MCTVRLSPQLTNSRQTHTLYRWHWIASSPLLFTQTPSSCSHKLRPKAYLFRITPENRQRLLSRHSQSSMAIASLQVCASLCLSSHLPRPEVDADGSYHVDEKEVPVQDGQIVIRIIRPTTNDDQETYPALVWFHGGGKSLTHLVDIGS